MAWTQDAKTGAWSATDSNGNKVVNGQVSDSHGLANIKNGVWDGTYAKSGDTPVKNTVVGWNKDDSNGNWSYVDSSGKTVKNGQVADSKGLANIVNGVWDGTYGNNTQSAQAVQAPTLKQVVQTPSTQQTVKPVTNNSTKISSMYDQQLASAQAALKNAIQQSIQGYQKTIDEAPGIYTPLKNQASVAGQQDLQNLREMLANNGQQGGVNRTEETQVNSNTENNISNLQAQQQKVINDANTAINNLNAQGDLQGAQLVADNAAQKLQALITEANRVDSETYSRSQDAFDNAINEAGITGLYKGQPTMQSEQNTFNNGIAEAGLTGSYKGQQTMQGKLNDANVANTQANTEYQRLINENYPAEEALKMAQAQATLTGTNLANDYQKLVNAGYPAQEAADLAYKAAQTANLNKSTSLMGLSSGSSKKGSSGGGSAAQTWSNLIYGQKSNSDALKVLLQHKSDILNDLMQDGMSGDSALKYWQNMQTDLSG